MPGDKTTHQRGNSGYSFHISDKNEKAYKGQKQKVVHLREQLPVAEEDDHSRYDKHDGIFDYMYDTGNTYQKKYQISY